MKTHGHIFGVLSFGDTNQCFMPPSTQKLRGPPEIEKLPIHHQCFMPPLPKVGGLPKSKSEGGRLFEVPRRWQNGAIFRAFLHIWRVKIPKFSRASTYIHVCMSYLKNDKISICKKFDHFGWHLGLLPEDPTRDRKKTGSVRHTPSILPNPI